VYYLTHVIFEILYVVIFYSMKLYHTAYYISISKSSFVKYSESTIRLLIKDLIYLKVRFCEL